MSQSHGGDECLDDATVPHCTAPHLDVAPGDVSLASPWQPGLQPVVINAMKKVKEVTFLEGEFPAGHTERKHNVINKTCRDITCIM